MKTMQGRMRHDHWMETFTKHASTSGALNESNANQWKAQQVVLKETGRRGKERGRKKVNIMEYKKEIKLSGFQKSIFSALVTMAT